MNFICRNGTYFPKVYIHGGNCPAVCMPSRAMLHTGRSLFAIHGTGETIPADHVLMAEHFRKQGYATFGTGKWHNGAAAYARSFSAGGSIFFGGMDDHWNVPVCDYHADGCYPEPKPHAWISGTKDAEGQPEREMVGQCFDKIDPTRHSTDLFSESAAEWLTQRKDREQPFLMYVAFMAPHDPRTMPQHYRNMYDETALTLPPNLMPHHPFDNGELAVRDERLATFPRTATEVSRHLAEYYAMISHLDNAIGRILDALKASGSYDDTIIVLAGDNGLALGSHGLMGKQNLYEHSIGVPLLMAGPGIPEGGICAGGCYLHDLFPTLCDLTGLPQPGSMAGGQSLAGALTGSAPSIHRTMLFAYRHIQRAAICGNDKIIVYNAPGSKTIQLFNLADDPWEMRDLAADPQQAVVLKTMQSELAAAMSAAGDPDREAFISVMHRWIPQTGTHQ
jgi:arylsulfatase A-like enzyme